MRCIAHRGFAADAPENTCSAVRFAANRGANAIELDVRTSADGEPVVVHDETVDRVTGADGPVETYTTAELRDLSVLGTDDGIPALADVLDVVPPALDLVLEFKETGLPDAVWSLVREVPNTVLISSFRPTALEEVADATSLPRALLVAGTSPDPVAAATDLGVDALHVHHEACDEALVDRAHDAGLDVAAWTIEVPAEARRLRGIGADGIIADTAACCGLARD